MLPLKNRMVRSTIFLLLNISFIPNISSAQTSDSDAQSNRTLVDQGGVAASTAAAVIPVAKAAHKANSERNDRILDLKEDAGSAEYALNRAGDAPKTVMAEYRQALKNNENYHTYLEECMSREKELQRMTDAMRRRFSSAGGNMDSHYYGRFSLDQQRIARDMQNEFAAELESAKLETKKAFQKAVEKVGEETANTWKEHPRYIYHDNRIDPSLYSGEESILMFRMKTLAARGPKGEFQHSDEEYVALEAKWKAETRKLAKIPAQPKFVTTAEFEVRTNALIKAQEARKLALKSSQTEIAANVEREEGVSRLTNFGHELGSWSKLAKASEFLSGLSAVAFGYDWYKNSSEKKHTGNLTKTGVISSGVSPAPDAKTPSAQAAR